MLLVIGMIFFMQMLQLVELDSPTLNLKQICHLGIPLKAHDSQGPCLEKLKENPSHNRVTSIETHIHIE